MSPSTSNAVRYRAILFLVITAILWSTGGLLIKMVSWNPVAIAGMRSAIASLVMLVAIRKPKFTWSVPQIGAAVAYAATVTLFVVSNKLTTSANAILLQYTAPIYIALFGTWILKERAKLLDWITIFFVLGGMVLFFLDDLEAGGMLGNIIAILSGISFAFIAILMRKQKDGSPIESILLGNILTALIGIPFMFEKMPDASSWWGLILLGVFQLGIAYVLYSIAIKHVTALEAVLIPIIEPILNPIWVLLIVGEIPGKWALVGGVIVLFSVTTRCVVTTIRENSNPQSPAIKEQS